MTLDAVGRKILTIFDEGAVSYLSHTRKKKKEKKRIYDCQRSSLSNYVKRIIDNFPLSLVQLRCSLQRINVPTHSAMRILSILPNENRHLRATRLRVSFVNHAEYYYTYITKMTSQPNGRIHGPTRSLLRRRIYVSNRTETARKGNMEQ